MAESSLDQFRVGNLPSVYIVPDFINESDEQSLIDNVYAAPRRWKELMHRRLQNWGGVPHSGGLLAEPLPPWLDALGSHILNEYKLWDSKPNHVLVNEYNPGSGIMPHEDGPLYRPCVAILSTGSATVMDFYTKSSTEAEETMSGMESSSPSPTPMGRKSEHSGRKLVMSVWIPPRSLLVFRDDAYTTHLHSIADRAEDVINESILGAPTELMGQTVPREKRLSFTIRVVCKVIKLSKLLGK